MIGARGGLKAPSAAAPVVGMVLVVLVCLSPIRVVHGDHEKDASQSDLDGSGYQPCYAKPVWEDVPVPGANMTLKGARRGERAARAGVDLRRRWKAWEAPLCWCGGVSPRAACRNFALLFHVGEK
jgi:hypothetical protein